VTVTAERHGRVLVIRIERETKRNAIDAAITAGLDAALNRLDDDAGLWAGVLTGTTTVFSAGTDLRDGSGDPTPRGGEYGLVRRRRTTPLIAAVEGVAFGGGFELAMACDLVVASQTARFALPETRRGVVATSGALFRAVRSLPLNVAKELLLAGSELDAETALRFGLVNRLTGPGGALAAAIELAENVCRSSPAAVRATMAAIDAQTIDLDAAGWRATEEALRAISDSDDLREGIAAFLQRREPRWTGR
jgi:enoyl-CoA hydratase/carnithine racemase